MRPSSLQLARAVAALVLSVALWLFVRASA